MDKVTIVKVGGKVINEDSLLIDFLTQFSKIEGRKILVHGGGRSATNMLGSLGIEVKMLLGRRVTDRATLDVCIGQYAGNINKKIVALLQSMSVDALGLSGADGGLIKATLRSREPIDYGFAGDIESVDSIKLLWLLNGGFVPVFCAITADQEGQLLNTNADTIASALAVSLGKEVNVDLRFCFEYSGVLSDLSKEEVLDEIETENFQELVDQGMLSGGIIPKVENAIVAKRSGVEMVSICGIPNLLDLSKSTKIV